MNVEKFSYDNKIVKYFAVATVLWGMVGMLVGIIIAIQLIDPAYNAASYLSFGRLRPLHTNAVIFAFVGNGMFMGVYYSLQRLMKARMFSDTLSWLHFWGWQLIIVLAALTLPFGISSGKEYAELEWPIDIMIALVWVIFTVNMFGTIFKRRERHLYVAVWFYIATVITVAVLHIVNSLAIPVSLFKSYSVFAGVQDALVQWWYGHNAVAFFLTTPFLGLMYYFIPKAANRPVYSYRLSIIHFWALIFIYIWAGPHHLLYNALPDWAQSLGVVFSVMLIAPSWGGMINGLLTLRGAWDKVRESPVLKFMVVAITAYGMATFEGPMLSLKNVNAIAHFTDWIVAHVHVGGLGWNGMLTFGILYWLVPKMYNTNLYSKKLAGFHFWAATLGIIFYAVPMYWAGFTQSLMWKEFTAEGVLRYPNFLETVIQIMPMYKLRVLGGILYFIGAGVMIYNLVKTAKAGSFVSQEGAEAPALTKLVKEPKGHWHRWIERRPAQLMFWSLIAILIGGLVELVPMMTVKSNVPVISSVKPYTPLELHGRDIYLREGCYTCHSQMIRPFRSETERYGEYSKAGEFVYDHPFQWGSKRNGPDLARVGGKYPNSWHYNHMIDVETMSPGSLMPSYPFLAEDNLDLSTTADKIRVMKKLGVPYSEGYESKAVDDLKAQAKAIADDLESTGIKVDQGKEIIALIAYLQKLGVDIRSDQEKKLTQNVNR
ncbi:MAG: cytochrome-c oxidase, cbb3-type subunit I [Bacteroidetes bacterium]|nr:MAG: cytochrome-c oxidase, cbb3-type subunit I [Bacteroidota bacterium]REK05272.1 MAG: cytochrome-c oxidase, cbb3-type subunit I [Bacteroidota bacterium]REK32677.1 MAG: cytochrome-c oxidase, cbb3-type subunit I [Bacteroidota bacterium]REK48876.1 MAG: cytochrome-c oxidase, cbb3-type subunit I [Bacteroidota bacterium]